MSPDTPQSADETTLPPLRDVIARHGLSARRSLGQHFLLDLNLTRRIARAAGPLGGCTIVEIGPGPGGLTRALLETRARRIVVVERDSRCRRAMEQLGAAFPGRLEIVEADALKCDLAGVAGGGPCVIVANLPYNIGTRLLLTWLRDLSAIASMTLMFQKEVADRIVAPVRTASYGRLSVITQWLCETRALFDISPRAFVPPPKVTSTLVRLVPRPAPLADASFADLEAVTAAAFGQRRKMLRSALRSLGGDSEALLDAAGIQSDRRAETLAIEEFCALARARAALFGENVTQ